MRVIVRLLLCLALATGISAAMAAQDLAVGTKVLAQTNTDVNFHPATVVKKALDGYTVRFEDGTAQDVLQSDMAFSDPADPSKLAVDTKVAAFSYDLYSPGKINEIGEDNSYLVAWEGGGADPVTLENIHLRMAPRSDPRPKPVATTAPASAPASTDKPAAAPSAPKAAATPPSKAATPPPKSGSDEDNPLMAILGMAGDRFLMTYSLTAPAKSSALVAKTDLADITLEIPQDYVPVGLDFKVKNKSGKALSIDWSKCYVTSFAGAKRAIYHVQYQSLEEMPTVEKPTAVPAGEEQSFSMRSRESQSIVTTFHAAEYDKNGVLQPKWNEILNNKLFFGADLPNSLTNGTSAADQAKDLELMKKNVVGKSFKVGAALVSAGKTTVVEFAVRIDDLQKSHEANLLDSIGK
ncbi:MAG: hypothetical protein WCL50_05545 [Spirochaetota bacterium]